MPDLAKSTATRTLGSDGMLMERVELDGARALITTEKLEEWLCGFPVQKF